MRQTNEVTQQEVDAYNRWCEKNSIINKNDKDPDTLHNADVVLKYFTETWQQMMTDQNFDLCFEQLRPHLKFYEQYQQEFEKYYSELSREERSAFDRWPGVRGLIKEGAAGFRNGAALLGWIKLHGFPVSHHSLFLASGQNKLAGLLQYDGSEMPSAPQDPRRHNPADFTERPPQNEPMWKRLRREREEREAAAAKEAALKAGVTSARAISDAKAKAEALLQGPDHAENEQLGRLLATANGEVDWIGTLAMRQRYRAQLDKQRAVARRYR
jgi:hypothetical protein